MEDFAQALQDALGVIPVHLGAEWLDDQSELPHVIVVPSGATYGPVAEGVKDALASGTRDIRVICKAARFDEAEALADLVYASAPGRSPLAKLALRSEVWGNYTVRVADLLLTLPTTLTRTDITRVRVTRFTQLAFLTGPQEVPSDPTPEIDGETQFVESD